MTGGGIHKAGLGYAIRAAQDMKLPPETIQQLVSSMKYVMDMELTVEEAERVYERSPY